MRLAVEAEDVAEKMRLHGDEAEREKRGKIIHAEGEFNASQRLAQAAAVIATEPGAMTLRYLQTLTEIAGEKNSTILFPIPVNLMSLFQPTPSAGHDGEPRSD